MSTTIQKKQSGADKLRGVSLATKFALGVTAAIILILLALGLYFERFLDQSFLRTAETQLRHSFSTFDKHFSSVEEQLSDGVAFIQLSPSMLASVKLINTYEDKKNYNTFLIDEEKKLIAAELLKRVKLSFNSDIALYNAQGELIAYVVQRADGYHLNYISYASGEAQLFRRHEGERRYHHAPLQLLQDEHMAFQHVSLYDVSERPAITRHLFDDALVIKAHRSISQPNQNGEVAHVEMSKFLKPVYFAERAAEMNMQVALVAPGAEKGSLGELDTLAEKSQLPVVQTQSAYLSAAKVPTMEGDVYLQLTMDRSLLNRAQASNRQQLLVIMILVALCSLVLVAYLIRHLVQRPLAQMVRQIENIERQDYRDSGRVRTGDELETISRGIDELARTVRQREESLEGANVRLQHLSNHDALTGLPNRRYFSQRLDDVLNQARESGEQLAIFFIDLDQFKQVNDTQGHIVGDKLLRRVAERLRNNVRETDTLARIGGDEFNLLIEKVNNISELERIAEYYQSLFDYPFHVAEQQIDISTSIGISVYPIDGHDSVTLIKNADMAMYKAKEQGRNNYCFFSEELSRKVRERAEMSLALKDAVSSCEEFTLYYQPKVSIQTGRVVSVEALLRWQRPGIGIVPPDQFIPLAEELGYIHSLGKWILVQACYDFMQMQQQGVLLNHVGVNVSNVQLEHREFVSHLADTLQQTGIRADQLELEITESYLAGDLDDAIQILQRIRGMGLGIAIDDFGTGYSAMSFLQKLPVTRLKIDKSFVDGLPQDKNSIALVRAIISLANSFGLALTAEGVETQPQLDFLIESGCDEIQGYFFSKPLPFDELLAYVQRQACDNVIEFPCTETSDRSL